MLHKEKLQASKMWKEGLSQQEIADHFGMKVSTFATVCQYNRDLFPSRKKQQSLAGNKTAETIAKSILSKPIEVKERFPPKAMFCEGVTSSNLKSDQCCFPLWGDHERYDPETSLWCGGVKSTRSNLYCGYHANITTGRGTISEQNANKLTSRMMAS